MNIKTEDFAVENHGTIWTFEPVTKAAREHAVEAFADAHTFGLAYVVEHRFANEIIGDLLTRGYTVTLDDEAIELRRAN